MFAVRTGIKSRILPSGRGKGSIRHKRFKKERKKYRCWVPFLLRPCLTGFGGIGVLMIGVAMCTVGYYADHFSTTQINNGTHTWDNINETQSFLLSKLTYMGPMIMAVGCLMLVVACVLVCEKRDKVIKQRIEAKDQAVKLGIYIPPPKRKNMMELLVNRLKQWADDCRSESTVQPQPKVGVINSRQSQGFGAPVLRLESGSSSMEAADCEMFQLVPRVLVSSEQSEDDSSDCRLSSAMKGACSVLIHQQRGSVSSFTSERDAQGEEEEEAAADENEERVTFQIDSNNSVERSQFPITTADIENCNNEVHEVHSNDTVVTESSMALLLGNKDETSHHSYQQELPEHTREKSLVEQNDNQEKQSTDRLIYLDSRDPSLDSRDPSPLRPVLEGNMIIDETTTHLQISSETMRDAVCSGAHNLSFETDPDVEINQTSEMEIISETS